MAYGIDPKPFYVLRDRLAELPGQRPEVPGELEAALFGFIDAFDCLLRLMDAILQRCVERAGERRAYRRNLLPLLARAHESSVSMLTMEIREGISASDAELVEMVYALRDSLLTEEAIAFEEGIRSNQQEEKGDDESDPDDEADAGETITDSFKKFIKRFVEGRWVGKKKLESILETIDEIISVVRKVI
ncbi:MAG: hypothetical protein WCE51_16720 [Chthoniobacterales bacterium]